MDSDSMRGGIESVSRKESWNELLLPSVLIIGLILLLSLDSQGGSNVVVETTPSEAWLKLMVGYLSLGAEVAAAMVIAGAVLRGILDYLRQLVSRARPHLDATEAIRLKLGRVLVLGLEFTVASDILRTAVAPTRQDILDLGAIVLLRTLLNYFLEREIQQGERNRSADQEPGSP